MEDETRQLIMDLVTKLKEKQDKTTAVFLARTCKDKVDPFMSTRN